MKLVLICIFAMGLMLSVACSKEDREAVSEAADKTGDAVSEAADKTGDAVEEAADKTGDAVEDAADEMKE